MSDAQAEAPAPSASSAWNSPILAHAALMTLVILSIGQAIDIFSPKLESSWREQQIFQLNPKAGTPAELQALLDQGWRITHCSTSMSASSSAQGVDSWFTNTIFVLER